MYVSVDTFKTSHHVVFVLEQGTGVKKNRTLGLELLEKAADMVSAHTVPVRMWLCVEVL